MYNKQLQILQFKNAYNIINIANTKHGLCILRIRRINEKDNTKQLQYKLPTSYQIKEYENDHLMLNQSTTALLEYCFTVHSLELYCEHFLNGTTIAPSSESQQKIINISFSIGIGMILPVAKSRLYTYSSSAIAEIASCRVCQIWPKVKDSELTLGDNVYGHNTSIFTQCDVGLIGQ